MTVLLVVCMLILKAINLASFEVLLSLLCIMKEMSIFEAKGFIKSMCACSYASVSVIHLFYQQVRN